MKSATLLRDIRRLNFVFTNRDRVKFLCLLLMMIVGSVLEALGVGLIPAFISFIMSPASLNQYDLLSGIVPPLPAEITSGLLLIASALLMGFTLIKSLFLAAVFYVQARLVNSMRVILSSRMFNVYQSAPYEWHLSRNTSEIQRNIREDTAQVLNNFVMALFDLLMAILMSFSVLIVLLLSVSGIAMGGMLIMAVGLLVVVSLFKAQIRRAAAVQRQEAANSVRAIQEGFGALVDARINNCEDYLAQKFRRSMFNVSLALRRQTTIQKITPYAIETCAIFGLLFVVYALVSSTESLQTVLPTIGLFGVVAVRLKQTTSAVATSLQRIQLSSPYIDGLLKDLEELNSIAGGPEETPVDKSFEFKQVSLNNVSFSYLGSEKKALQDITLSINAGSSTAFIGETGCGKSTLMSLMLGLLEPVSGSITLNGIDLNQCKRQWWNMVGYIPQHIYLLDDSIRANVAFGLQPNEIDDGVVWDVLKKARMDSYVKEQPLGLDTVIGERGVRLSGGQRQRLGIARALYKRPQVLFMDEATSALDSLTEGLVMEAINEIQQNTTIIMIAHRLSTVKSCEKVYFMKDGKFSAFGSYQTLREALIEKGIDIEGTPRSQD